jgi:hypothetical protein
MPNPFTQTADAVRSALEARWDAMADDDPAKVKIGNRWGRNARKDARQVADFPAVDIRPVDGRNLNFTATSSTGLFQKAYELGIATDGTPVDDNPDVLDAVEWSLTSRRTGGSVGGRGSSSSSSPSKSPSRKSFHPRRLA